MFSQTSSPNSVQSINCPGYRWRFFSQLQALTCSGKLLHSFECVREFFQTIANIVIVRGRIYSQFNPKWVYVLCVVVFEIGSAVCGAAPSMNALIIGRALAGLGGGGMYLGVMMMLSLFTTPLERPKYIGIIGVVFGFGTV